MMSCAEGRKEVDSTTDRGYLPAKKRIVKGLEVVNREPPFFSPCGKTPKGKAARHSTLHSPWYCPRPGGFNFVFLILLVY